MDTQIRRVDAPLAAVAPGDSKVRLTLPLPHRSFTETAPAPTSKTITPAVTLAQIRHAILRCAEEAARAEPTDTDARLHSFMAKLSGTMESLGQHDLDTALWELLSTAAPSTSSRTGM